MVVTHKSVKEQKARKFDVKEDDARYKHYTKAQAVAENKRKKEDRDAVARYQASLKKARDDGKPAPKAPDIDKPDLDSSSLTKEVSKLEYEITKTRGPGAKAKKAALREKITLLNTKKEKKDK